MVKGKGMGEEKQTDMTEVLLVGCSLLLGDGCRPMLDRTALSLTSSVQFGSAP